MKKRILLIGGNFYPELTGIGKYNSEMMHWFAQSGYDCGIVTTYPYYPQWKIGPPYNRKSFWYSTEKKFFEKTGGKMTIYRCPHYVPKQPSGATRMISDFSFLLSAFFRIINLLFKKKYDVVLVVVPPFPIGFLGILYKTFKPAKMLYHFQDLQIDAAWDLKMIKSQKLINFLFYMERKILEKADWISSISDNMIERVKLKSKKKDVFLFPNWANTKMFFPVEDKEALKKEFGFTSSQKIILYSGAVGEKQGLESVLFAAEKLQSHQSIIFIISGTGPYKEKLKAISIQKQLSNVLFFDLQPVEKFNNFLNMADVHLVIQKANASDLMMPSKLTTILAVGGLALVTANKQSGLYQVINKYKMGITVDAENEEALLEGIKTCVENDHSQIIQNARSYAEQYLNLDTIMNSLKEKISLN